uniref:Uncharacterized protein n=1 Tax=viral metagenome TaxID=1070528 RepID=A0A6M3JEM6_9ZZZZ
MVVGAAVCGDAGGRLRRVEIDMVGREAKLDLPGTKHEDDEAAPTGGEVGGDGEGVGVTVFSVQYSVFSVQCSVGEEMW